MLPEPECLRAETPAPASWRTRLMHRIAFVDTPRRAAAAFALGVFLSFSPFFGFQTAIGMATAVALRLSKVAVFAGLCMNLPWIMVPWYTLTTIGAASVLGTPIAPDFGSSLTGLFNLSVYGGEFWRQGAALFAPFLGAFLLGPTIGAVVVALATFVSMERVIARAQVLAASE